MPRFEHVTPFLRDLEWLTISEREKLATLKLIFKIINGLAPSYLREILEMLGSRHGHNVRKGNLLSIPAHRTTTFCGSLAVSGARLWNSLPTSLRFSETLTLALTAFHNGVVIFLRSQE